MFVMHGLGKPFIQKIRSHPSFTLGLRLDSLHLLLGCVVFKTLSEGLCVGTPMLFLLKCLAQPRHLSTHPMVYQNKVAKDASKCIRSITRKPPKNNQRGNTLDEALNTAHSEGLGEIIQILTDSPHKILPCLKLVQSSTFGIAKPALSERAGSGDPWPDSYHLFRLIPKYWLWAWVQSVQPRFTAAVLELIEGQDRAAIRKIIEFCTGRRDTSKVPPTCLDKLIMARTLRKAYEGMGARLSDEWFDSAISPTGEILWQSSGVFRLNEHEGKVHSITHIQGFSVTIQRECTPNLLQSAQP
jgi:hypothetical protein